MEQQFSWRHAFALLVTFAAALTVWFGTRLILTEPPRPPIVHLMHISLAPPPAPPAPVVLPKPAPPKPAVVKQRVTRTQSVPTPTTNGPVVATSAPLSAETSQSSSPAPPSTAPAAANVSLQSTYINSVRAAVEEQKRYPMSKDARLQQPQGTVTVWFILNRDGSLVDSGIEVSAGNLLDRAALESVRRATFPPFPASVWPGEAQHRFQTELYYKPQ